MKLTSLLVEGFAALYLSPRYDTPQPTPDFHRECWDRYCSDHPACATAAPRNHAKSTGLTHDFILANALFRVEPYIILIGASEEMAIEHLNDIANELRENEELIAHFKIKGFVTEQRTDIIVECEDGYQFRIIARGAEQKIRGRKWRGRRPGLLVGDDLEDDEQVENRDRRTKFRKWFFRAAKQALRDGGRMRVHGTILHEDSLLAHLMKNPGWNSKLYKAHASFDDFSEILWPEKFPEERLRAIRQELVDEGDAAGYSQEYLNDPLDYEGKYLQKAWLLPMSFEDHDRFKIYRAGVDFAISKKDSANRSSFTIGGQDSANLLHIVDQEVDRMDTLEIIETFFRLHEKWGIDMFFVEDGQIWKAIAPVFFNEMKSRDIFISITPVTPVADKAVRGRAFQKRARAGGMRFDKNATWYPGYEEEILKFTGEAEATLDDQFDSTAHLCNGCERAAEIDDEDELTEEEVEFARLSHEMLKKSGRSAVTGY